MEIRIAEERRPERCLYCHDSLGSAFFTCDSCGATYHRECTEKCVNLGCQGAVHLDAGEREKLDRAFSRVGCVSALAPMALIPVVLCAHAGEWGTAAGFVAAAVAIFFVVDLVARTPTSSRRRRREHASPTPTAPRVTAVERAPATPLASSSTTTSARPAPALVEPAPAAPGELQMPSLFAAHPIAMDDGKATTPDDVERAQHQREARHDRLRPPGLGKTI